VEELLQLRRPTIASSEKVSSSLLEHLGIPELRIGATKLEGDAVAGKAWPGLPAKNVSKLGEPHRAK
jgi:hypothetical protein